MNHIYESGTVTIKGDPGIKVGKYIEFTDPDSKITYYGYVKSRHHIWRYETGQFQTILGVIRCVDKDVNTEEKLKIIAKMAIQQFPDDNVRNAGIETMGNTLTDQQLKALFNY
jgi:hypothetical protein